MADSADDTIVGEARDTSKKRPKAAKMIFVAAAIVFVVYFYNTFLAPPSAAPTTPTEGTAKRSEPSETGQDLDVSGPNREGYVPAFEKRLASVNQDVLRMAEDQKKQRDDVQRALAELKNEIDQKLGQIVEQQTALVHSQVQSSRQGAAVEGALPPLGGIPGSMDGELGGSPSNKTRLIKYVSFGTPMPGPGDTADITNIVSDAKYQADKIVSADNQIVADPASSQSKPKDGKEQKRATRKLDVAAGSKVHVTTLHSANCPVGQSAVTIVFPVMGTFKGPNGSVVDLGHGHLLGKCTGLASERSGDKSRARVVIERLSIVGPDGKQQNIKVTGYVADRRDSAQDISGHYESKQGIALAKSAAASGLAAIGQLQVASEMSNTVSAATGTTLSTLTGDATKAALGAAISATAQRSAEFYQSQVEALVPTVHIEAQLPLEVFFTDPFQVELNESEETHAGLY